MPDNANANNTTLEWLRKNTTVIDDTIRDNEFMHIQYATHIFNLIVAERLKEVDESILKVWNLVKYVKTSPRGLASLIL